MPNKRVKQVLEIIFDTFNLDLGLSVESVSTSDSTSSSKPTKTHRLPSTRTVSRIVGRELDAVCSAQITSKVCSMPDGQQGVWGHDGTSLYGLKLMSNQYYINGEVLQLSVLDVPTGQSEHQVFCTPSRSNLFVQAKAMLHDDETNRLDAKAVLPPAMVAGLNRSLDVPLTSHMGGSLSDMAEPEQCLVKIVNRTLQADPNAKDDVGKMFSMFCHLHHIAGVSDRIDPLFKLLRKIRGSVASSAIDWQWRPTEEVESKDTIIDALGLCTADFEDLPTVNSDITAPERKCCCFVCMVGCRFSL